MSDLKNEKMQALSEADLDNVSGGIINNAGRYDHVDDRVSFVEPDSFSKGPRVYFRVSRQKQKEKFDDFIKNRNKGT